MIEVHERGREEHQAVCSRPSAFLFALGVVFVVALTFAGGARAVTTFTVNGTGDDFDAGSLRDGVCDTVAGAPQTCTLRAAIQEASDATVNPGADTIAFDPAVFTGNASTSTVVATNGAEPAINEAATIDGGDCDATAAFKPCVGFQASGGTLGLTVSGPNVEIRGLAVTNGSTGVAVSGSNATIAGNWFGLRLDETAQGNDRGIELSGEGSDLNIVGGETAADRNVFANNSADGLRISGGDTNTIKGNYFGTKPDGTTAAANGTGAGGDNIEVSSIGGTANPASNNTIGGTLSTAQLASPECDGPCNVIANSTDGIDLDTEGGSDGSPVSTTTIKGNFIGLDRTGQTQAANINRGIRASTSNSTNSPLVVGGPDPGDRNVISGNTAGGLQASDGVTVRNNYFSSNSDGDAAIPNMGTVGDAFLGTSVTPTSSTVQDNRFVGNGTAGGRLTLRGGTEVIGNTFGIGTAGEALAINSAAILVSELDFNVIGGPDPGDANTIGNVAGGNPAILINGGNSNQLRGNLIGVTADGTAAPNSGPGIRITNFGTSADQNMIGGDTQAEENVISNSGGDAIEIVDDDSGGAINNSGNAILRNRGSSNGATPNDLFIDLRTDTAGNGLGNPVSGPNAGIQALSVNEPTANQIDGAGAASNARVRVFKTVDESVDGIRGFVNDVTDPDGATWTVSFPSPLPNGQCLSATQTDTAGNTSELPAGLSIGPDPCDVTPPTVTINSPASGATTGPQPTFSFSSADAADTYECRFDSASFGPCSDSTGANGSHSPGAPLSEGAHTFHVRGTDAVGNTATEVSRPFTVDATPPDTTIASGPAQGSTTSDPTPTFSFSSNEAGSTFQCKVDGDAFVACTTPRMIGPLSDGQHTFQVRATDPVDNVDSSPASRSFTVDTTAPSNDFSIGGLKGRVLTLTVPGPGVVQVTDAIDQRAGGPAAARKKLLKPSSAAAAAAGQVMVKLKLVKAATKKLKNKGKVTVSAAITFTPTGGTANTQTAKLSVKKKKRPRTAAARR